jgi:peptide subunit release factor 1 (eRF1)
MTIRYTYDCPSCGNDYIEQRTAEESQYFSKCSKCETELNLVSETPLEDN